MARFLVIAGVALVLLGLLWGPLTRLGVLSVGVGVVRALLGR
jgi:hypothetical protein